MLTPDKAIAAKDQWRERCFNRWRRYILQDEADFVATIEEAIVKANGRVDLSNYERVFDVCIDALDDEIEFTVALARYIRNKYSPLGWHCSAAVLPSGRVLHVDLTRVHTPSPAPSAKSQVPIQTVTYVSWAIS